MLAYKLFNNPKEPWLVFLHGFLGIKENWIPFVKEFKEFCCCCIDLPGHGESHSVSLSFDDTLNEIKKIIKKPSTFIAYSMGGRLALAFTLAYPEYVTRLFLESASPGLGKKYDRTIRRMEDKKKAKEILNTSLNEFLKEWYKQDLFSSLRKHPALENHIQQCLYNTPEGLARSLQTLGTGSQRSYWEDLKSCQPLVHLIVGDQDDKFMSIAARMQEENEAFSLHIIPSSGHNAHLENPAIFGEILKKNITGVSDDLE
tara:strand:- start:3010 stop:3783 length:774 start_codon:yes stop_codon:yes gene_type:complete